MRWGDFSDVVAGVGWKRLTPHEVDPAVSRGHEFQGVTKLQEALGAAGKTFDATYVLLGEEGEPLEVIHAYATWYNSRERQENRTAEWRLYYPAEAGAIQATMSAGDLMVLARSPRDRLIVFLARAGSSGESELLSLFRIDRGEGQHVGGRSIDQREDLGFIAATILEELGIALPAARPDADSTTIEQLVSTVTDNYNDALPRGETVSALIQKTFADVNATSDPDAALVRWIEAEAAFFRRWEDDLIARRVQKGFLTPEGTVDVEGFREFAMRIRQSRVSRAGRALQNHVEEILRRNAIRFEAQQTVDEGETPDFLFPGAKEYRDVSFPSSRLRMLAVKFTAKERWRQVLNEAGRIATKHLLTVDSTISSRQLHLMRSAALVPVLPVSYRVSCAAPELVMSFGEFINELRNL